MYEKKCISRGEAVAPATQSKLSRVSSGFGLSKLTGVRRNKKENSLNKNSLSAQVHTSDTLLYDCRRLNYVLISFHYNLSISDQQETFQWMFTHIAVVRDLVAMQYKEYQEVPSLPNTVVARILASLLDMMYKQHTQKRAAAQNNRLLYNSAVGMLLQDNKPSKKRSKGTFSQAGVTVVTACVIYSNIFKVTHHSHLTHPSVPQRQQNALKYVTEEWASIEYELLRERGLWGPPIGSHLDKFVLEMTEGPCRMRKKMVRNDMFYIHYPYIPEMEPNTNSAQVFSHTAPLASTRALFE